MKRMTHRSSFLLLAALAACGVSRPQEVTVTGRVVLVGPKRPGRPGKTGDNSNAVVWLGPLGDGTAQNGATHAAAAAGAPQNRPALRLVQKQKHFTPHVLVVPVGAAVEFPNLDPFFHNVFSLFEGKRFDLGLYESGSTRRVRFDRPGICYIFCNIHSEMSAVVVVLETPYGAVSNRAGDFSIAAVPPGRYQLEVWHERAMPEALKSLSRAVTVSEDSRSLGIIRLSESGNLAGGHQNKYGRDYDTPTPPNPLYEQP